MAAREHFEILHSCCPVLVLGSPLGSPKAPSLAALLKREKTRGGALLHSALPGEEHGCDAVGGLAGAIETNLNPGVSRTPEISLI